MLAMHASTLLCITAAAATHVMSVVGSSNSLGFSPPPVHHGTVSMWAGASDLAERLPELRAHPTVNVDVLMLGTDVLVHSNGSLECIPNCTYWRDSMAQVTAAGIAPWAWITGGSVGGAYVGACMHAFTADTQTPYPPIAFVTHLCIRPPEHFTVHLMINPQNNTAASVHTVDNLNLSD